MRRLSTLVLLALTASAAASLLAFGAVAGAGSCSGDFVIAIGAELRAGAGAGSATVALSVPVPPGEYSAVAFSSDQRGEDVTRVQDDERWTVRFVTASGDSPTLGPTSDLEDMVAGASRLDDLGAVTFADAVVSVVVTHVLAGSGTGGDSVTAECVGLTRLGGDGGGSDGGDPDGGGDAVGDGGDGGGGDPGDVGGDAGDDDGAGGDPDADPPEGETDPEGESPGPPDADPGTGGDTTPPPSNGGSADVAPVVALSSDVALDCASSSVVVSVANSGTGRAVVDVAVPRSAVVGRLDVAAGAATTTTIPLGGDTENRTLAVRILDSVTGDEYAAHPLVVDCRGAPAPGASVTSDCEADRLLVDLTNRGGEAATVRVVVRRDSVSTVTLGPGLSERVEIDVAGKDQVELVVLDRAGIAVFDRVVPVDCLRPEISATASVDCASGEVVVVLDNSGGQVGSATVAFSERLLEQRVGPASTARVSSSIESLGGGANVIVRSGEELILETVVDTTCVVPTASIDFDCADTSVTLVNSGAGTARFTVEVTVDGVVTLVRPVSVGDSPTEIRLPAVAGPVTVTVTEATTPAVVEERSSELDCGEPFASVEVDCSVGVALIEAGVEGGVGTGFVVLVDDTVAGSPASVTPGAPVGLTVDLGPTASSVEVMTVATSESLAATTVDCGDDGGSDDFRAAGALVLVIVAMVSATGFSWRPV